MESIKMERSTPTKSIKTEDISSTSIKFEIITPIEEVKLEGDLKNESRPKRIIKTKFLLESVFAKEESPATETKSKLKCVMCRNTKTFPSKLMLNRHIRKVHEKFTKKRSTIIICEICSAELKSEAYFKRHMETRHPPVPKIFSCDNCGKDFHQKDYLRIHMDRHRLHQILTCTICQKSYISRHTFRRHLKTHVDKFVCTVCGFTFNQKMLLENHFATKHSDELPYKCKYCTRLFSNKTARNNHFYNAHKKSQTELSFKCNECNIYFEMKEELRIHSFIHFNGDIRQCLECDQIFKTTRLLNIHMQKHETKKSFQCTNCGEFFTFKTGLGKHIRLNRCKGPKSAAAGGDEEYKLDNETITEIALGQLRAITNKPSKTEVVEETVMEDEKYDSDSDESVEEKKIKKKVQKKPKVMEVEVIKSVEEVKSKETRKFRKKKSPKLVEVVKTHKGCAHLTYICDYCGDSIKFKKAILSHIKQHTINQRYKCKECVETFFKSRQKLIDHSIEVHRFKPQVVKEAFSCPICDRKFDARSTFEAHKLSHDETSRNHICTVCSAAFKSVGNLRRHEAIHAPTRDFHCESCQKSFKTRLALKVHTEAVHASTKFFVKCQMCGVIVQEKHLNQHVKNQHTEDGNVKPFECSVCKKTFRSFKLGQRHFEAVHESKNRGVVYTCPHCPELQFFRQRDLKEHSFIHFDGIIYQCDVCLKMFKSKRLLMIHQNSHNEIGFPCKICDAVFKTRGGRRKHMLRLHSTKEEVVEYQEAVVEGENEKQIFMLS